ncbi:MAG TPA: hypothetical protein VHP58_00950 [Alphaproteobacteria bacterium]|nr:hypothetical protein [Alphaproteobacteria bacterium]
MLKELQNEGNASLALAAADEVLKLVPGSELLVKAVTNLHRQYQLKRLGTFLSVAELDAKYLEEIVNEPGTQELFLEYVSKVINTPSSLACAALALVYRSDGLRPSMKILISNSLSNINSEILDFFIGIMEHAESIGICDTTKGARIQVHNTPLKLPYTVAEFFIQDLQRRNLISSSDVSEEHKLQCVDINNISKLIFKFLKEAREVVSRA